MKTPELRQSQFEGKITGLLLDRKWGQDQLNVLRDLIELIELIGLYRGFLNSFFLLCFYFLE